MFMMVAVFARPEKYGVLKCGRAEDQGKEPHQPVRLKSPMGEQPVIPGRDGKSARKKHHEKKPDLECVQAEEPEISRHGGDRQKQSADQE